MELANAMNEFEISWELFRVVSDQLSSTFRDKIDEHVQDPDRSDALIVFHRTISQQNNNILERMRILFDAINATSEVSIDTKSTDNVITYFISDGHLLAGSDQIVHLIFYLFFFGFFSLMKIQMRWQGKLIIYPTS